MVVQLHPDLEEISEIFEPGSGRPIWSIVGNQFPTITKSVLRFLILELCYKCGCREVTMLHFNLPQLRPIKCQRTTRQGLTFKTRASVWSPMSSSRVRALLSVEAEGILRRNRALVNIVTYPPLLAVRLKVLISYMALVSKIFSFHTVTASIFYWILWSLNIS